MLENDFKQYEVSLKEDKSMLEVLETGLTFYMDKVIRDLITANTVDVKIIRFETRMA